MKPRQTVKNYHNSNVPPYQHQQQQNSSIPTTQLNDIDLVKLGLNLDDMPNLQANPTQANQEEIVKCLQAIYGKDSAELLKKLPALSDWPLQSVSSPPDYSRNIGGSTSSNSNCLGSGVGVSGVGSCLSSGFSNNNMNNDLGQQEQDVQFMNSQHSNHQASAMNQFRVSNTSNIHSPQQQKSVLSLHQHHHQNDLSNRRLNHHHHHLNSTNASFANLSSANSPNINAAAVAAAAAAAAATSTSIPSDVNNLGSSNISSKNLGPSAVPTRVSNIMDTLGSMDSMFFDGSSMQASNKDPSSSQQSLIRHQQLQKLLRATGSQLKSTSQSTNLSSSHRSELHSLRNLTSSNMMSQNHHQISSSSASSISPPQTTFTSVPKSLLNLAACSSSSPASTNTSSLGPSAKFSSMVNQLNLRSARNAAGNQANLNNSNINNSNCGSLVKNTSGNIINNNTTNDAFNQKSVHLTEHGTMHHMNRSATSTPACNSTAPSTRSSSKQQFQWSLLSDDQSTPLSTSNRTANNLKSICNVSAGSSNSAAPTSVISATRTPLPTSQTQRLNQNSSSKEAYLADLQERAARAGVSIGEISKPIKLSNNSSNINLISNNNKTPANQLAQQQQQQQQLQPNTVLISPNQSKDEFNNIVDRKEIESALSRVEARNDLSLLYPPMLLASNSQKHINALSAGLEGSEDSELFTQEVKKIILEECNIIYECKECNNLFRSLANLVKHKRSYCTEHNSERNAMELNKRPYLDTNLQPDQQESNCAIGGFTYAIDGAQQDSIEDEQSESHDVSIVDGGSKESAMQSTIYANDHSRGRVDKQQNLANELRMRIIRNQERKINQETSAKLKSNQNMSGARSSPPLTSLTRILQSQPKQRLPVSRDSALIGALSMASIANTGITAINSLSPFESEKNIDCSPVEITEQLARNSSLAKTLLNEKARGIQPRQSLIELSKVLGSKDIETPSQRPPKRVAPKRKFLEDCIQKVKRDKLLTEDEEAHIQNTPTASISNAATISKSTSGQNSPVNETELPISKQDPITSSDATSKINSPANSDLDSDMLTIDLDAPKKEESIRKGKRRISATASTSNAATISKSTSGQNSPVNEGESSMSKQDAVISSETTSKMNSPTNSDLDSDILTVDLDTPKKRESIRRGRRRISATASSTSSSSSSMKLNTSSALLKALTRPVDAKRPYNSVLVNNPVEKKALPTNQEVDCEKVSVETKNRTSDEESTSELQVLSPLFEKYTCDICNIDWDDLTCLMIHTIEKHIEEKMIYPCIFCSLSFISLENVCRHIIDIHKKPKSQVHRLKEVVRSRSFISSDFLACSDHPAGVVSGAAISDAEHSDDSSSSSSSQSSSSSSSSSSGSSSSSSLSDKDGASTPESSPSIINLSPANEDEDSWNPPQDEKLIKNQRDQQYKSNREPESVVDNNSESEMDETGVGYDSNQVDESDKSQTNEQRKESVQRPSSVNKSTAESTPSSSSAGGSGGIMKLKIQLKTRPDEKSKVYEIV